MRTVAVLMLVSAGGMALGQTSRPGEALPAGSVVVATAPAEMVGTIAVTVKDEAGKAVVGATVIMARDWVGRRDKPAVTDENGVARVKVGGRRMWRGGWVLGSRRW